MADTSSSSSSGSSPINSILETSLKLCRCIEESLISNPHSDGTLNWDEITSKMKAVCGPTISKSELQIVWKYIAYGKKPTDLESTACDSDGEEPFYQPFSAVKRFRSFTTAQNTKKTDGTSAAQEGTQNKHYLTSTIPSAMKAEVLGRNIKIDIPKHVVQGLAGIQPPIYISASETSPAPRAQSKPLRVAKVTHLVAQDNESFANALMPPAPSATYGRPAGLSTYPLLSASAGTQPGRPVPPIYQPAGSVKSSQHVSGVKAVSAPTARPVPPTFQPQVGVKVPQASSGVKAVPTMQNPLSSTKQSVPSYQPAAGMKSAVTPGGGQVGIGGASSSSAAVKSGWTAMVASASAVGVKRPAPAPFAHAREPPRPPAPVAYAASSSSSSGAGSSSGSAVLAHPVPSASTMPPAGANIHPVSAVVSPAIAGVSQSMGPAPTGFPQPGSGLPPAGMQRAVAGSVVITRPSYVPGQRAIFVAPGGSVDPAVANLRRLPVATFPTAYPRGFPVPVSAQAGPQAHAAPQPAVEVAVPAGSAQTAVPPSAVFTSPAPAQPIATQAVALSTEEKSPLSPQTQP